MTIHLRYLKSRFYIRKIEHYIRINSIRSREFCVALGCIKKVKRKARKLTQKGENNYKTEARSR